MTCAYGVWRAIRANCVGRSFSPGHGGPVTAVRFGGDGRWLASAAADGSLNLWDLASPVLRPTPLRGHDLSINGLRFSPEGDPTSVGQLGKGRARAVVAPA